MPTSYIQNVLPIMYYLQRIRPTSVLDVGTGYGKFAFLLREYIDDFKWNIKIDGVEAWPRYFKKSRTDYLYDTLYKTNFLSAPLTDQYDIILMIDVLEHFNDADANLALKKAAAYSKRILISVPLGFEQGAVGGNEFERHQSEWPLARIEQAVQPYETIQLFGGTGDSVIAVAYHESVR
ncbi:class I SAM-dependent methyltransferase [Methylobacterium aerolatum]|uniref:SAM-dependent methyltransferase n=1 Tax=Methylobacterium aerolatum TaxID=418708 RepID=A0ABU0I2A9_9HYPH|nr:class I SAM-dependent methyltransferase [Methylobacterium aerolatum]MDQ0447824.1 SAM-dependent methyltransferase [Methylobacterium aerolatum]